MNAAGKRSRGRPSKYNTDFADQAKRLCEHFGATDWDLAQFFDCSTVTLNAWKKKHPEFLNALKLGKDGPDERVERSLFARAVGYTIEEEQLFHYQGRIIRADAVKHYPPDVTACLAWLNNRRPERWRQRPEGGGLDGDELVRLLSEARDDARSNV